MGDREPGSGEGCADGLGYAEMDGMKLLPAPRLRIGLFPTAGGLATVAYLLTLALIELTSHGAATDLHDLLAGLLLVFATAVLVVHHRRRPLHWLTVITDWGRRVIRRVARWKYDLGTDLRGTPVLPGKLPRPLWVVVWVLVGVAVLAELAWLRFPGGWRAIGVQTLYLPYLLVVMAVWVALLGLVAAGLAGPLVLLDRRLRGKLRAEDRRVAVSLGLLGYVFTVVAVSWVVPIAVVLVLVLAVAVFGFGYAAAVPAGRPGLLWRSEAGKPIHSIPARRLVGFTIGFAAVAVYVLLMAACGGRLMAPPSAFDPMPVTTQLGGLAAWLLPGLFVTITLEVLAQRRLDPARRTPPTLTVHPNGQTGPSVEAALRVVRRWSWGAEVSESVKPGEVGVALVPPERSEATEFDPRWPLAVSVEDLEAGAVRERLVRRNEVQRRREVFRGLAVLLKRASRGRAGGGVWFAPHWWLNGGLLRDRPSGSKPGPPRRVGPPFASVYSLHTIQHLHAVLRAVQIDLVFIEDGVSRKQFERVFRAVFELYDVHGGLRPAEDRHFLGLPRVKATIHEYTPGEPTKPHKYRQPKFDDLTRARVLHVYREDDGIRAEELTPFDTSWEPSPALGIG